MRPEPEKKKDWQTLGIIGLTSVLAVSSIGGAYLLGSRQQGVANGAPAQAESGNRQQQQRQQAPPPVAEKDLKIKGNRASRIYHLPGCPNYHDISEAHTVWFKTHEAAKAAGYRMARNC